MENKLKVSPLTDTDRMPFGKHKGEKMANVPARYLIWLWEEKDVKGRVRQYIESNLSVLREEVYG